MSLILVAIQVMWFGHLKDERGTGNGWVRWMIGAAESAQMEDPNCPDMGPEEVLWNWSRELHQRFNLGSGDPGEHSVHTFRALSEAVATNAKRTLDLAKLLEKLFQRQRDNNNTIQQLRSKTQELKSL